MTPHQKHKQTVGQVEALPDNLRDMLLGAAPAPAKKPKIQTHKTGLPVPLTGHHRLSKRQKAVICQAAAKAYRLQSDLGLIDDSQTLEAWRRDQQLECAGEASLSQCEQTQYRKLLGHFNALAGSNTITTFNHAVSPADDHDRQVITQALRTERARMLRELPADFPDEPAADAYIISLAWYKGTLKPSDLSQILTTWPVKNLRALLYTVRNRIAAKLGIGSTRARNKSQRKP